MTILNKTFCGIIQVRGAQCSWVSKFFGGSWGRYFVGKLCDVTREDNSYLIYLQTSERVIFVIFFIMLQNRDIFLVKTPICPVIENHLTGFQLKKRL